MNDYLVRHAISNVWCTPDQDNQLILKPRRLTPPGGVFNQYQLMWSMYLLPVTGKRYHLYDLGQINPILFNLFENSPNQWATLASACNSNNVVCDVYVASGVQIPRVTTWYMLSKDRTVLLAVEANTKINFNFDSDDIYLRVYRNAYFNSVSTSGTGKIQVGGTYITSSQDIADITNSFNAKQSLIGGVYCFINGVKVTSLSSVNLVIGDVAEYVYDNSIVKVLDFCLADLQTFDSTLDSKGKYLLHYSGSDDSTIDYMDDIDVFVINSVTNKGLYFHKNMPDALRNLTHRDYSVPVAYVLAYISRLGNPIPANTYIRLHVRKSGYNRTLIKENHRIDKLYLLSDSNIKGAMLGVNSTVDVWAADNLESSEYVRIMGLKSNQITNALVTGAYGYNSVSKLVAKTPMPTTIFNSQLVVYVGDLFKTISTVFEYDINGILLGWYPQVGGTLYNCTNSSCNFVEIISGVGSNIINDKNNIQDLTLLPDTEYRFYKTLDLVMQDDKRVWTDVTGTTDYTVTGNSVHWNTFTGFKTLVRTNKDFLLYALNLTITDGTMRFNLQQNATNLIGGIMTNMLVPMGELDIFLNGKSLIRNLDYFVTFPHVNIVNKEYLANAGVGVQHVVVRYTGFCTHQMQVTPAIEVGFVVNNKLSVNNKFNIFDDKNIRFVVNGKVKNYSDLSFAEDSSVYVTDSSLNGKPYLIRDLISPLRLYTGVDTYDYRNQSLVIDTEISDYLTTDIPQNTPPILNTISQKYKLFSPFISEIIYDLSVGLLYDIKMEGQYNDTFVRTMVASYMDLYKDDPLHLDNRMDPQYVVVHPHHLDSTISLSRAKYAFLNRVIGLYGNGLTQASSYVLVA